MEYFKNLLGELEKGRISPLYLFYGPEVYLQHEAVKHFRAKLVGEGNTLNFLLLDGEEVSAGEVVQTANTLPLFTTFRLVVIRNAPYFGSGRGKEEPALLAYLRQPADETCLIFCTAGSIDKRRQTYKLVEARGRVVEFTHLNPLDLKRWFQKRARQAGKTLTPAAEDALLAAGRDLSLLYNEIEKVLAYTGEKSVVTAEDVAAVSSPAAEETVFAATDAFGERRFVDAVTKLRALLEKEPPGRVLSLLVRQLKLILIAQDVFMTGKGERALAGELEVPAFVAKKVALQARRFPRLEAEALLWGLLELDFAVKSGSEEFLAGLEKRLILSGLRRSENYKATRH
jgi:DNA polymerase-3 subunit delta